MIRSRLFNPLIRAVSYEAETRTLVVELTSGKTAKYSPVSYETYLAMVNSRFPEKIYRHQVLGVTPVVN